MEKFLAIYTGSPKSKNSHQWNALSETDRQARVEKGMEAWGRWAQKYQKSIVFDGSPLGKTKQINGGGISDIKNSMAAYVVVEAHSHEEAAKIFLEHPHFNIFPGDSVEVMECLPIPNK